MEQNIQMHTHFSLAPERRSIMRTLFGLFSLPIRRGKKAMAIFVALWVVVSAVLFWWAADTLQENFNREAKFTIVFLEKEGANEEGPRLIEALKVHRDLLDRARQTIEAKQAALPLKILRHQIDFEARLAEATEAYKADPGSDEDSAGATIRKAASLLEKASRTLMVSKAKIMTLGTSSPPELVKVLNTAFRQDLGRFEEAATAFLAAPSFSTAEEACFRSRFTAVSVILAWPEVLEAADGRQAVERFRQRLDDVRKTTIQTAQTLPNREEAKHLTKFASNQERRIKVLDALLNADFSAAENALAMTTMP